MDDEITVYGINSDQGPLWFETPGKAIEFARSMGRTVKRPFEKKMTRAAFDALPEY